MSLRVNMKKSEATFYTEHLTLFISSKTQKGKFSGKQKELANFANSIKDLPFDINEILTKAKQAGITDGKILNQLFMLLGIYHSAKKDLNLQ